MNDGWLEVVADGVDGAAADDVAARFEQTFGDGVVVEARPGRAVRVRAFLREREIGSRDLAAIERHLGIPVLVRPLVDRNWGDAWREAHAPLAIGARLVVQPPWLPIAAEPTRVTVRIDPGMAFGVGSHASTRLALEVLGKIAASTPAAISGARVLDVGTGTGILSLAALGFGATRAVLCDIDPHAGEAVKRNAALNDPSDRLAYYRGSTDAILPPAGASAGFDLVLANIVAPVLLGLFDDLVAQMRGGASLVLSGIFEAREPEILAAAADRALATTARVAADGFVALALRRRNG